MQILANSCRNLQKQFTKIMVDYENSIFFYILTKQICLYKSDFQKTALDIMYLLCICLFTYLLIYFHFRCPDITRLYTLSEPSVNGIPLYVLEFTDNPGKHELCKYY